MTHALVVDDKPENLYLLRALLQGHGYSVDQARHGAEALTLARQTPPDLVISDLLMPVMDGYTLLRHWKADARLRAIPFVVYTATYTEPKDERLALDLGADAFIVKPAEPEPFMARIQEVLAQKQRGALPPAQTPHAGETILLQEYNATLVRKLEKKALQLEEANQRLQKDMAARQVAEAALREALDIQSFVIEGTGTALWDWDLATNQVRYSREWKRMLGYVEDEVANHLGEWKRLTHPDDVEPTLAKVAPFLQQPAGVFEAEFRMRHKSGQYRWILSRATAKLNAEGKPVRLLGLNTDITERKQAEDQLQERERRLSTLISNLPGAVFRVRNDHDYTAEYISDQIAALTGYPADDFRDNRRNFGELMHPDDRDRVWNETQKALGEHCPYEVTYRFIDAHGREKWNWERGRGAFDANGELQAVEGFVQDITERKQAEQVLQDSEERFRATFEQAAVGIAQVAPDGRWLQVNRKLCDIVGYSREELLQRTFQDITYPEDLDTDLAFVRQMLTGEIQTYGMEKRYVRKDGSLIWIYLTVGLVWQSTGEPKYFISVVEDISARKQAEADKLRLEQLLVQAQKMEAIGQLTAGIAHDFNNILASVLGYSSLALDQYVPDKSSKLADYLREVQNAGNRARELIASLLAFSRSGSSDRRRVLVGPLVKEVMKTLEPAIRSSIALTANIEAADAHVLADPVQLYQVIMNLVINARDALGEHGRITVNVRRSHIANGHCAGCHADFGGDFVELVVSDTGPGIPAAALPHIFEPFFTTKATGKGSGLGLSVVHGVVHDCGGHVWVESTPNQGTVMRIVLPEAGTAEAAIATPLAAPAPAQPADGRHILVVDDDAAVAELIGETLQARGYRVTVYTDSREAFNHFAAAPAELDALVSDQTMPGLTGVELAKAVRALQPELPIILCTGYSATLDSELATDLGVRLFYKPAPFEGLIPVLTELFAVHPGAGKPAHVLLVDDDDSVVILITRILEQLHYQVTGAADAKTALATLTANPREYDVLVTDIGLPDRSGLELARAARQLRPDLPIILTTGALRPGEAETAQGLGIQDIVLKPNTVRELGAILDRLVREARRPRG